MTKPLDILWEVVQNTGETKPGISSGAGSTTTLVDSSLGFDEDVLKDGLLFVLSGLQIGIYKILGNSSSTITFSPATGVGGILTATSYGVCLAPPNAPSVDVLRNSVSNELIKMRYLQRDVTTLVAASTYEYALPAGLSDLRRVEVAQSNISPYNFLPSHSWEELMGYLIFDSVFAPTTPGNIIRLWYYKKHAVTADITDINAQIPKDLLIWAATVSVWRKLLVTTHKDNPVAVELFNEAKGNYQIELRRQPTEMNKDPKYA